MTPQEQFDAMKLELLVTILAALGFLVRYGWPGRYHDRTMAWHIYSVTVVALGEAAGLFLALLGVRLPLPVYLAIYGAGALIVVWRFGLLLKEDWVDVKAWLYSALRTFAQALWGLLVAYLAKKGITLPDFMQGWFVDVVILSTVIGAGTAGIRWLETRKGDSLGARLARRIAAVIMLGLSAKQPVYAPPDTRATPVQVTSANGQAAPTLRE